MNIHNKYFYTVLFCLLVVLGMHMFGMKKIVSNFFPERIISIDEIKKIDSTMHNFTDLNDGQFQTDSIASWIYLDYNIFGIVNPQSVDYVIYAMDDVEKMVPMYYVPSYTLQAVERRVGTVHVDLDYASYSDIGLRFDFTNQSDRKFAFGNFVINENRALVQKYLQWFDCMAFFCCFFSLCIFGFSKKRESNILSKRMYFISYALVCTSLLSGYAIVGLCLTMFILRRSVLEKDTKYSKLDTGVMMLECLVGVLMIFYLTSKYLNICEMFYAASLNARIENAWLIMLVICVGNLIHGIVCKNSKDYCIKLSKNIIIIALFYMGLDVWIKSTVNTFELAQWMNYLRTGIFSCEMIVNILFLCMLFLVGASIIGINLSMLILGILYSILICGNFIKLHFQGTVFTIADLSILKEAYGIAKQFINIEAVMILLLFILLIGCILVYKKWNYLKQAFRIQSNLSILYTLPVFALMIFGLNNNFLQPVGIDSTVKFKQERASINAYGTALYYYYMVMRGTTLDVPANYDESIVNVVEDYKKDIGATDIQPNVILILAESLFRADQIPEVQFNYNLFENTGNYIASEIISPSYGGRTVVAEAEALTGLSNYFLDNDAVMYTTYLKNPQRKMGGLVNEFKLSGYTAIAMHPNTPDYYNRRVAYQCMGFDTFYSINDFQASKDDFLGDGLMKDQKFFDFLIQKLDESDTPTFVFGATIGGHSPYEAKYDQTEVQASSSVYTSSELKELSNYAQTIRDFDKQLGKLFQYLDNCGKPTLVYVFGDHLPPIAINSSDGYLNSADTKYTTPLIAYSNYSDIVIENERISTSQIAPQIIMDSGIDHSAYFDFLYEFRNRHPILQKEFAIEEDDYVKLYDKIQYDILSGNQYLLQNDK